MKRKTLTTAVMAGLTGVAGMVGVANAVNLNPDGLGQVLLYPYYTARGGNDTLISVVNTTSDAKAVKVRFLEGLNSAEVFDFNLYLSAFDVWTGAITTNDDGGASIVIADTSCTVPYFYGESTPDSAVVDFLPFEFQRGENGDGGPQEIERVASGHFEIIEMGTVVNDNGSDPARDSADAVTHVGGVPADCQQLVDAWTAFPSGTGSDEDSYWNPTDGDDNTGDSNSVDLTAPSGGLFGGASIINVAEGTMFSYNATAIDAFSTAVSHTNPGSVLPNLNGANLTSNVFINGTVETDTWQTGIEAVSATMLFNTVLNEYVVDPTLGARSEWVMTFPTKRAYVDEDAGVFPSAEIPQAPFTAAWNADEDRPGTACEPVDFSFFDREEGEPGAGPGPDPVRPIPSPPPDPDDPPPPDVFELCFESNVVRFAEAENIPGDSEILKEPRFTTFPIADADFLTGWARFEFNSSDPLVPDHATRPTADGDEYLGLPVLGFWVNTFSNGTLNGGTVLSNYGGTFQHRGSRQIQLVD